jgi:hypothetical protein
MRSVVNASATPARNKNSGAGSVPPNCEYRRKLLWREAGDNQES